VKTSCANQYHFWHKNSPFSYINRTADLISLLLVFPMVYAMIFLLDSAKLG